MHNKRSFISFCLLFSLFLCNISDIKSFYDDPTLSECLDVLKTLKPLKDGGSSEKHSGFAYNGLTKNEQLSYFQSFLLKWINLREKQLKDTHLWLPTKEDTITPTFDSLDFQPFIEKIIADEDDIFVIRGDLHGDVFSLTAQFSQMYEDNLIDRDLKLKPNIHIITLGDHVDRGIYGGRSTCFLMHCLFKKSRTGTYYSRQS